MEAYYQHALRMLQTHVQEFEDDELIQSILDRGSRAQEDTPTSSPNVDEIMRSMMGSTASHALPELRAKGTLELNSQARDAQGNLSSWKGKEPAH